MSDDETPPDPDRDERPARPSGGKAARGDYEVGYGKPPHAHKFKKDRPSPNPFGRGGDPKKKKNLIKPRTIGEDFFGELTSAMVIKEAYRLVTIREGGKSIELPAIQAVIRANAISAMKGNRIAAQSFVKIVQHIEDRETKAHLNYLRDIESYKSKASKLVDEARRKGQAEPELLPHPDDLIIDEATGRVVCAGPTNEADKREWDKLIAGRDAWQEEVSQAAAMYRENPIPERNQWFLKEWHGVQRTYDIINDNLPKRYRVDLKDRSYAEGASRPGSQKRIAWPE